MNIVEHVKFAIAGAQLGYMANLRTNANNGRFKVGETYAFEHEGDMIARAAVRATLEHARDNITDTIALAGFLADDPLGKLVDRAAGHGGSHQSVDDIFRAMIDALLQEIGGGG